MGVLNLTPDSFSDGGKFNTFNLAIQRIKEMIPEGADIIDIGGESTGPCSLDISAKEELARVQPIINWVFKKMRQTNIIFSIDTYKASVAEYALKRGFKIVNDVTALRGDPKMIKVLLKFKPYIILMYSKDSSARTTSNKIIYKDVIKTIKNFLIKQINKLLKTGFPREKIIIDPGMGAFISAIPDYSFEIIERLSELKQLGYPILICISRKSCLGIKIENRDKPSIQWSLKALKNGASIIRIHNVKLMQKSIKI